MSKLNLFLILGLLTLPGITLSSLGQAGTAQTTPPVEFMNLETCSSYSKYSCSLSEFSKRAFPSNFVRSWDQDGSGNWIFVLKGLDKVSGETSRIGIVFGKVKNDKGTFIDPIRVNIDGKELPAGSIPNFYVPIVEQTGREIGSIYKSPGGSQPPAEFMKLRLKRDEEVGGAYPFTVSDYVQYQVSQGAQVAWDISDPVIFKLIVTKAGGQSAVSLSKEEVYSVPQGQPDHWGVSLAIGSSSLNAENELKNVDLWFKGKKK